MTPLYRLKFPDGKVSNFVSGSKVRELLDKGKLPQGVEVQKQSDKSWISLADHPDFQSQDATFIRKLSDFGIQETLDSKEEKTEVLNLPEQDTNIDDEESFPQEFKVEIGDEAPRPIQADFDPDVTKVHRFQPDLEDMQDKTLVRPDTVKYLEKMRKEEESKRKEEELKKEEAEKNKPINYNQEATQVLNINDLKKELKSDLNSEIDQAEKEFEAIRLEKEQARKEKEERENKNKKKKEELAGSEDVDEKAKKRKKLLIYAVVLLLLFVVLFPSEKKEDSEKVIVVNPKIQFPVEYDKINRKKSVALLEKGVQLLEEDSYVYNLKASKVLLKSVEWDLENRTALEKLFLANALVLDESKDFYKDANTTFKIYKIIPGTDYSSLDKVKGLTYFYKNIGKTAAALNVLTKFSKAQKNTTLEIYALWLDLLLEDSQISEARKKYDLLAKQVNQTQEKSLIKPIIFSALARYANTQSDLKLANKWLNEGLKVYPEKIPLILGKINLYLKNEDPKGMARYLKLLEKLKSGNKPSYYARFLEYTGFLNLLKGNYEDAVTYFKNSLKIKESENLRTRLSLLQPGNENQAVNELIIQSKAITFYDKSKEALKKDRWREALKYIVKAADFSPEYIPVRVLMSKLQMRAGLYDQAIVDLKDAIKTHTQSTELSFALLDVYIKLYKFNDAKQLVNTISNTEIADDPRFPSMMAKMFLRQGDKLSAANWLIQSLNKNPLNDKDYFLLAELYIKGNRFEEARRFLSKAIELEPFKIEYRAAYAKYLYDSKGPDIAIGYLLGLERDEKFKQHKAYLRGETGIYYYRAGKIEGFKDTQKELEKMDFPKKNLYEYVIRTSLIENEYERVIENGTKLLEIEPGDIEIRMLMGRTYFEQGRYEKALKQFKEVKNMMRSYPRLKYFIAKAYLSIGQKDKAYEIAQEEVRDNPHLEDGYVLTGDIGVLREKWVEAEKSYRKALRIKGDSFDAIIGLAYINYRKNKQDSALALYTKAQRLNPGNANVYRMLGEVYRQLGQGVKAIENYEIYLKRVPNSKYKSSIQSYINIMR